MVSYPRGTSDTRRIRRLKQPDAVEVEADAEGTPLRLRTGKAWAEVTLMRRPWRIDQHWWRGDGIARMYYRVAPEDGAPLTLYHDLSTGRWYRQEYT
jgi:hypothetical protein